MFDVHKYLLDGTVKREKIAMDIKYREIGTEELNVTINEQIQELTKAVRQR